ncbi:MAG: hypothetical protein HC942_20825 [Microcoleus sp. SU_5_6]|nr:hypothetical protein [Microcoleus sp. SU_5_6]
MRVLRDWEIAKTVNSQLKTQNFFSTKNSKLKTQHSRTTLNSQLLPSTVR